MNEKENTPGGWKLWLSWTLVSVLAFAAGMAGGLGTREVLGETAAALVIGLVIGLAQWLVLRRHYRRADWWIAAAALGIALAYAVFGFERRMALWDGGNTWKLLFVFLLAGALTGLGQWLLLRVHLRRAAWWILASALTWLLGGLASQGIGLVLSGLYFFLASYAALGLLVGAGTGLTLVLLLRLPPVSEGRDARTGRLAFAVIIACLVLAAVITERPADRMTAAPDLSSRPACADLPPLECVGDDDYCSEVIFFEPVEGPGYVNYPVNGETAENQYRSYLRRDLVMAIQYATASVACETRDWTYVSPLVVLGLGDMSEADGSLPGTSVGSPGHPMGTHEQGNDIDVAYYQAGLPSLRLGVRAPEYEGNLLRSVCDHVVFGMDVYHCVAPPTILDRWRTALFIARLSEHPLLRVIGVDGQIGPLVEAALDELASAGWVDPALRDGIRLAFEPTDQGRGFFLFHHHHMHISFNPR